MSRLVFTDCASFGSSLWLGCFHPCTFWTSIFQLHWHQHGIRICICILNISVIHLGVEGREMAEIIMKLISQVDSKGALLVLARVGVLFICLIDWLFLFIYLFLMGGSKPFKILLNFLCNIFPQKTSRFCKMLIDCGESHEIERKSLKFTSGEPSTEDKWLI